MREREGERERGRERERERERDQCERETLVVFHRTALEPTPQACALTCSLQVFRAWANAATKQATQDGVKVSNFCHMEFYVFKSVKGMT